MKTEGTGNPIREDILQFIDVSAEELRPQAFPEPERSVLPDEHRRDAPPVSPALRVRPERE